MAELNCEACEDLRNNSAGFASNGVTTAVCNSLKNDTGFSTSNNHNDCTDLDLANDCLIGNMESEIERYDFCDWREFMKEFISNSHELYAAIICAICGIWTNIWQLWDEINALKVRVKALEDWRVALTDWIENTLKPWISGVNDWRDSINTWKGQIDTWKGQIDTWKGEINTWKGQIDTWKNTTVPATYLTKTDAANTYLTKTDASSTYLTKTDASNTYVKQNSTFVSNTTSTLNDHSTAIGKLNNNMGVVRCYLTHMNENTGGVIHAYENDDPSGTAINGFRKAGGISVRSGASAAPMSVSVIGSTARITGSLTFDGNMPSSYRSGGSSSPVPWLDFFNGGTEITTTAGNSSYQGNTPSGNLFLYEYKINPCDFGFKNLYNASLFAADGGDFQCRVQTYSKGDTYPYDYGWGPNGEGDGQVWNDDRLLIQVRLVNIRTWGITRNNGRVSPNGITMAIPCPSSWSCGSFQN